MSNHNLYKAKIDTIEKNTIPSTPLEFTTTCSLNGSQINDIIDSEDQGNVVLFKDMINNFEAVYNDLKRQIVSKYSLRNVSEFDLNFLLTDLSIGDIQSPEELQGIFLGASLSMPFIENISHQNDHHNGKFRKIFDLDKSVSYILGQRHSFVHPLRNNNIGEREYELINNKSKTLEPMVYKQNEIIGNNRGPISYKTRNDNTLEIIKNSDSPILYHGYQIDNTSAYESEKRPTLTKMMIPGETIKTEFHINCPNDSYQNVWYHNQMDTQEGTIVKLDDYSKGIYNFIEQVNNNRSTNFGKSGLWFNILYQHQKSIRNNFNKRIPNSNFPIINFTLKFRLVPFIEKYEDGQETIPFTNLKKHIKENMLLHNENYDNE